MEGVGEAPLVLISRNAELGDVSDFGGQTPPGTRRGHVCFSALQLSLKQLWFHQGCLAVFMLVSQFHQTFFRGEKK